MLFDQPSPANALCKLLGQAPITLCGCRPVSFASTGGELVEPSAATGRDLCPGNTTIRRMWSQTWRCQLCLQQRGVFVEQIVRRDVERQASGHLL